MHIDIFSDTVCPWCYIGKQRLERALARRPQEALTMVREPGRGVPLVLRELMESASSVG